MVSSVGRCFKKCQCEWNTRSHLSQGSFGPFCAHSTPGQARICRTGKLHLNPADGWTAAASAKGSRLNWLLGFVALERLALEWKHAVMTSHNHAGEFLTVTTADGMLIIHSSPLTLSWVPRDVLNRAYNFGGIVTVGTFDSADDAKRAAKEQFSVPFDEWRVSDCLPFEMNRTRTEVHTPEIDGHKVTRHGVRWK